MRSLESDQLLYDPLDQHDACGVGFVAMVSGSKTHNIIENALEALSNLTHRGAVDADGRSGDGAGLLTQIPLKFFCREAEQLGLGQISEGGLGVGAFFLPRQEPVAARCREIITRVTREHGAVPLGWRKVPVDYGALGAKALSTAPGIEQLLIARGSVPDANFETALYHLRRNTEQQTSEIEDFYIASLSSRTIVYKGLMTGSQLGLFYPDLNDADFESALAVFHQRYSTNTFPNWALAQPFRFLAHNGEINTISGNRRWMRAREMAWRRGSPECSTEFNSLIWNKGSDSASLDNALELSVRSGRDVRESVMMLIPEAYENADDMDPGLRAFYDHAASLTEPWDGPAAISFTDGQTVGAALDRNGLRPLRYASTVDGRVIVASETGVIKLPPELLNRKGRLGPGQMITVDTELGVLHTNDEIKQLAIDRSNRFAEKERSYVICPELVDEDQVTTVAEERELTRRMKAFGYTVEDVERILAPMLTQGKEPMGSMGDDTPLAFLSSKPRLLYSFFKQRFAQVTNPAIDPIRERVVMSLDTLLGARADLREQCSQTTLIKLPSPILSDTGLNWLTSQERLRCSSLQALFDVSLGGAGLKHSLDELCLRASEAVESGSSIVIISDLGASVTAAQVPMLLAVGAVHNHLIREGLRMQTSLIAHTGEARDDHQIACLIGFGANAVCPSLGYEVVALEGPKRGLPVADALRNYRIALEDGLLKIMAKMGVSTLAGYCGGQTFEIIGLDRRLVDEHFFGAPSRLSGIGLNEIAAEVERFNEAAFKKADSAIEDAGFFRYRYGGEYHSFNPAVFRALHRTARDGDPKEYERYAAEVLGRPPATLRDLIDILPGNPLPISEVEPAEHLLARFSTSGMSLGALSRKAHDTLAIAMNRLGAKSNSGEGGEDPRRFKRRPAGDLANSKIKQVASARFGVTPEYLVSADELEIKIAQGSKPGEGGQLPGHKVTAEIAALRHSVPGVTLISPPPHHDIYSIEDLAQLIYDLRQINPRARIAVKLVSESGIGTIAAGVAKAGADVIHIAGHDGGTGASPLGSIKNAGTPWELGLAEAQQALIMNGLRERVRLRVDGGLKTGRDVIIAAMLGADEFGFATAAVVALGCVMARQCHLNTCPVGIATHDPALRRKFTGTPEMVVGFFQALAEEVRQLLADIGFATLDQLIGRSDLLAQKTDIKLPRDAKIDLSSMMNRPVCVPRTTAKPTGTPAQASADSLAIAIDRTCMRAINHGSAKTAAFEIRNTERAIGARLAGAIAGRYGGAGLPQGTINLGFVGSAGQSFGAFNISGVQLMLIGEANDYVGKGMSGGEIVVRPPVESTFDWSEAVIIGNTVMYGATGGRLFAAGRAGERFCVRNSGGVAVVEGVGDHGCEYMTAGAVVVLGEVGRNFAAGMTGGVAYVFDEFGTFHNRCNKELVTLARVTDNSTALFGLVEQHYKMTQSKRAARLLDDWETSRNFFWQVITQAERVVQSTGELSHISVVTLDRASAVAVADQEMVANSA